VTEDQQTMFFGVKGEKDNIPLPDGAIMKTIAERNKLLPPYGFSGRLTVEVRVSGTEDRGFVRMPKRVPQKIEVKKEMLTKRAAAKQITEKKKKKRKKDNQHGSASAHGDTRRMRASRLRPMPRRSATLPLSGDGLVWASVGSGGPPPASQRQPSQRQPQHLPPQQLIPGSAAAAASGPGRRSGSSREPPPLSTTDVRPTPEDAETAARRRGDRRRRPPVPQFYGNSPTLPIAQEAIETTIMLKRKGGNPTPWRRLRVRYEDSPNSTIKDVKKKLLQRGGLPNGINKTSDIVLALGKGARPGRFLEDFEKVANISSLEPAADASAGRQRRSHSV